MPLYDCMLLLKPGVSREAIMDLLARAGKHVCKRNGVLTNMKSFGTVQLGYGIKKLDGRYYQGQLMQMTMMSPPSINTELCYLNKEDRLLRWLLVKHRDMKFGMDYVGEVDGTGELRNFRGSFLDDKSEEDDDDEEYEVDEQSESRGVMLQGHDLI